ncbi:MAG: zinc-dependent metalloproteinase lipoprotein [Prevotellaceae bacterium]|nr:zinc-dependent metalloproteinase lipoprotein [Prevotellaceae bacterium]
MKAMRFLLLLTLLPFVAACDDTDVTLSVSQSVFSDVSADGETLRVTVTTNSGEAWTASAGDTWCKLSPTSGYNGGVLQITVAGNSGTAVRSATVTVTLGSHSKRISITQAAGSGDYTTYTYDLPVIFHVFYQNDKDRTQYVPASRLGEILQNVNNLYADCSVDMNLKFSLATVDESGTELDTPGVEYIRWTGSYPIDCEEFMSDNTGTYAQYLWEPNDYINVMLYNFKSDGEYTTLGISDLPYSTEGANYLEGLYGVQYTYLNKDNLNFAYCVSINSLYCYAESVGNEYNTADINVTVAHELGHYLGLYHVFAETEEGEAMDGCEDTDYCGDTPSYNVVDYNNYVQYTYLFDHDNYTYANLVLRTNCDGGEFTSTNLMDYAVSYSNRFTEEQRARTRHVLNYSPLIPGPKNVSATRSTAEGKVDLPQKWMK